MQCPVCDDKMKEVERSGVMLDICPGCKGIWLDRGELDKLVSLSEEAEQSRFERPASRPDDRDRRSDGDREEHRHPRHEDRDRLKDSFRPQHKRKGSWLGDILEGIGGD